MDFWDLTKLLFRRWYVAGPLLILTLAGTYYAAQRIEPDYVATSYVQLVPPAVTPKQTDGKAPQPRNPWLDLGVSSLGKASLLTVQDQKVVKVLHKAGHSDNFTLTLDSSLPIVTFEVIGDTERQATTTAKELIKRFDSSVAALQNEYGAPKNQLITTRQLDLGDNITESTSKIKRALVAIGGIGLLLTVALTIAVDALVRRRRADRAEAVETTPVPAPAADGEVAATPPAQPVLPAQPVQPSLRGAQAVNINHHPEIVRQRARPGAGDRTGPGEQTAAIVVGEDRTVVLRTNHSTSGDKD